jgi:hypothetical protein
MCATQLTRSDAGFFNVDGCPSGQAIQGGGVLPAADHTARIVAGSIVDVHRMLPRYVVLCCAKHDFARLWYDLRVTLSLIATLQCVKVSIALMATEGSAYQSSSVSLVMLFLSLGTMLIGPVDLLYVVCCLL